MESKECNDQKTKRFLTIAKSKTFKGMHRIVEWHGKQPEVSISTLKDNITYGQAVYLKSEMEK